MEPENGKTFESKNGTSHDLVKEIPMKWSENLSALDLSNKQITDFSETVAFPPNLAVLNLSHNKFEHVPAAVLNLASIKCLDLSHNNIQYFDDKPNFCHSIDELNLSHNKLSGPPYWIWTESPSNLAKLDLNNNMNIAHAITDDYFEELMEYKCSVKEVVLYNCKIRDCLSLLGTFPKAKVLEIGEPRLTTLWSNQLGSVPCVGLDKCCDVERLNLSNTKIYSVEPNIDIYKNLLEINLSYNNIRSLPNQFCNLENLEICILSFNSILYLPEDMVKLKKLVCLRLDSNELCMLPEKMFLLENLKVLDLYDNSLYEVADDIKNVKELDLAQNFMEEPEDAEYLEKKERIRLNTTDRNDGRKPEVILPETEYSPSTTDDEELLNYMNNGPQQESQNITEERSSSPEDWDLDEYWVPGYYQPGTSMQSPWLHFIKQKINEGNFCPIDLHQVSIVEKVRYEKMCNPKKWTVVEGQFDDLTDDYS